MNIAARVKAILLSPKTEWPVIDAEPASVGGLYSSYIVPLAAIPAICQFVGLSLIGFNLLGTSYRMSIASGITNAVIRYVLSLVGVYVLALIIDGLAPTFGGEKNQIQALKVAAYSFTAAWVCGIFALIPAIAVLGILGLYSLYLLYLGLPVLMKAPEDKAMGYTVVVIVCGIVIFVVIGVVARQFVSYPGM